MEEKIIVLMNPPISEKKLQKMEILKLYDNFKKRVRKKQKDNYIDRGEDPKMLRIIILRSRIKYVTEVLVKYLSFEIIKDKNKEIGFSAEVYLPTTSYKYKLYVLKKGNAYMEKFM